MISQTKTWLQKGTEQQAAQTVSVFQDKRCYWNCDRPFIFISVFPDLADLEVYFYCMLLSFSNIYLSLHIPAKVC